MIFMVVHSSLSIFVSIVSEKHTDSYIYINYYRILQTLWYVSMYINVYYKNPTNRKNILIINQWYCDPDEIRISMNLIYPIDSNWFQLDQLVPGQHNWFNTIGSTVGSTVGLPRCWPGMTWHNVSITWDPPWNPGVVRSSVESRDLVDICWIYVIYM